MAMGTRKQRERQEALWYRSELPEAPGHPFYRRLNDVLEREGYDRFCEARCREFYHERLGRPSLAPGIYFRLMMIGFFEGIDSERGIAWRVADSLTLREFLRIGLDERTPDHVTISRTRRLIGARAHQQVFGWVLKRLARGGLMKGKTIGVDSTTLEANAAMKSIVRRNTQESYSQYLERLAEVEGVEAKDAAAVRRMDRKRRKQMRNEEWVNPNDPEAEITRLKDGRTALAYKAEQAVDMQTGAIVAVTTHAGATGDTESIGETVAAAGEAVAEQMGEETPMGRYPVHEAGVEEVVADRGYHSNEVMRELAEWGLRSYIAEPDRGARQWQGRAAEQAGVRQPAAESGSAGPAFAGATRRACGAEFCASVRYRRNGPVVGEGSRQRAQEAVATSRGVQPGAVDAGLVWSGQAQSRARPWGRVHFCDFAALSGLYENLTARGAAPADQAAPLPVAIEWAVAFKNGRFRDGLLADSRFALYIESIHSEAGVVGGSEFKTPFLSAR